MLEHGGKLNHYIKKYGIASEYWLDLSTGINPNGWPVPPLPEQVWTRLPEHDDDLLSAAANYYGNESLIALPGSQAAIQFLPQLREPCRVKVIHPCYAEHAYSWQKAGHDVEAIHHDEIDSLLAETDVLIIINPTNPSGRQYKKEQLLSWHQQLQQHNGWLVVDEAFIDTSPDKSLCRLPAMPGLLILRSVGKFFGLAGCRVGFLIAEQSVLDQMKEHLGPWPIATASRYITIHAFKDTDWQQHCRQQLQFQSARLAELLTRYGLSPTAGTDLFQWVKISAAKDIHEKLAKNAILTRLFESPASLRFGLPANEQQWQQLEKALQSLRVDHET